MSDATFDADVKRIAHVLKIEREEGHEVGRKVVTQIVLETEADVSALAEIQHDRDLVFSSARTSDGSLWRRPSRRSRSRNPRARKRA